MTVLWAALGAGIAAGVLEEIPGLARVQVSAVPGVADVFLPDGVTFGPFGAAPGPLGALGLFAAATGGAPLFTSGFAVVSPGANDFLTILAGSYPMAAGPVPDGSVLTVNSLPLTAGGSPLQVT